MSDVVTMRERFWVMFAHSGAKHWPMALQRDKELLQWVWEQTAHMPSVTKLAVRVYAAISGTNPVCLRGNQMKLKSIEKGWGFCAKSNICPCAAQAVSAKCKKTWGNKSSATKKQIASRTKQTVKARYGVTNVGRLPQAKAGHQAFFADLAKVAAANAKRMKTMLLLHGHDNALKLPKVRANRKAVANSISPASRQAALKKRLATIADGCLFNSSYRRVIRNYEKKGFLLLTPREDYSGVGCTGNRVRYLFRCLRCEAEFHDRIDNCVPSCPTCDYVAPSYVSGEETAVADFVESLGVKIIRTARKLIRGVELDIFVPEHNLAIEYCGLYFHSEFGRNNGTRGKDYHLAKLKKCEDAGIRLLTIFSDEWLNKTEVCVSRIAHALKQNTDRVFARRTEVVSITKGAAKQFLDLHHIQGYAPGNTSCYGLRVKGTEEIISVMTFGPLRTHTNNVPEVDAWELYRFASSMNVVGGASKMFSHFVREQQPERVISFCDRRWGIGTVYHQLGFELHHTTAPGYFWVEKHTVRHHRSKFTKQALVKQGFDATKSETEIMLERGFDRIWDCGHLCFEWKKA